MHLLHLAYEFLHSANTHCPVPAYWTEGGKLSKKTVLFIAQTLLNHHSNDPESHPKSFLFVEIGLYCTTPYLCITNIYHFVWLYCFNQVGIWREYLSYEANDSFLTLSPTAYFSVAATGAYKKCIKYIRWRSTFSKGRQNSLRNLEPSIFF